MNINKISIAAAALTILAFAGLGSTRAHAQQPSKVTGGGSYQHFVYSEPWYPEEFYPSDEAVGRFEVSINPDKKSPRAVIHVYGPALEAFWGGPLFLQEEDADYFYTIEFEGTPKPGQVFGFVIESIIVWVFVHDNSTPGCNTADANFSDWFGVWIEDAETGNGAPDGIGTFLIGGANDDLFTGMGTLISGNIMDHRQ